MRILLLSTCVLFLMSCGENHTVQGEWIKGTKEDQMEIIEEQFGGFSQTMTEIAYRYQELYWAGQDENWEFADYQLEHIDEALEAGLVRRPEREKAAEHFITFSIPQMEEAIESEDLETFNQSFEQLRIDCRNCHFAEKVPFIEVSIPKLRITPNYIEKEDE